MIGHCDDSAIESLSQQMALVEGLLRPRRRLFGCSSLARPLTASVLLLAPCLLFVAIHSPRVPIGAATAVATTAHATWPERAYGVSLGGWLVMEINPSKRNADSPIDLRPQWMYDQFEGASELDFVTALRRQHGDDFAIQTMRNHWTHYYTDEMLDAALALGVNTMRLPVGYWIVDAPVGGTSALEYGISPEGFVTGGLNHLKDMLIKLKKRNIGALVDVHAAPCNSACVSDGLYCASPLAFVTPGTNPIGDMKRCGLKGGVYPTSRVPQDGERTWDDVGRNSVEKLAKWLSALPTEAQSVVAFQLANEPALGADAGMGKPPKEKEDAVNGFYAKLLPLVRAHLPSLPLVLSFIPPTDTVMAFLQKADEDDAPMRTKGSKAMILADHHYYLNFQQPDVPPPQIEGERYDPMCCMTWPEIHRRACTARHNTGGIGWDVYVDAKQSIMIGEWSLAVNHDQWLDLSDAEVRKQLTILFKEQLEVFHATPKLEGSFYWALRMGSGWDPRPTDGYPEGRQLEDSSAWKSLETYPFQVWSLLEMARLGIAQPLDGDYEGTCEEVLAAEAAP